MASRDRHLASGPDVRWATPFPYVEVLERREGGQYVQVGYILRDHASLWRAYVGERMVAGDRASAGEARRALLAAMRRSDEAAA